VRYEFGQQAATAKTNGGNWVVNAEDLSNNPYAGKDYFQFFAYCAFEVLTQCAKIAKDIFRPVTV